MSSSLFEQAKQYIPGGVNSPVRSFNSVDKPPLFVSRANGPYIYDDQGREYIDFVGSWGPMILGHNHPAIREAVIEATSRGTSFGACTEAEIELAKLICNIIPSMDKVRLVNSGTEATMSALRLARGVTGRDSFIKFRGCYHGHGDSFLIEAGSGALTHGHPSSPGVTKGTAEGTLLADYNDLDSVAKLFEANPNQIACLIVEPIPGNMGVIIPRAGFLQGLRELCDKHGALLIFDEVMSGFRVSLGGAQELYHITPDLTTLGKIIGGGLPVGAYGGKKEFMDQLSPEGPVYQAGTLSGNPLATAAGIAALSEIKKPGFYESLNTAAQAWEKSLRTALENSSLPYSINRVGSMMTVFFNKGPVETYADALKSNTQQFAKWFGGLLDQGVFVAPSQFEAGFLSAKHTPEVMVKVNEAVETTLQQMQE